MEESAPVESTDAPTERSEPGPKKADVVYGVVVGTLYVLAVGIQVFLVVDEVTHGALSTQAATWWREFTAKARHNRRVAAEFRSQLPWVLWEAQELVDEARDEGDDAA